MVTAGEDKILYIYRNILSAKNTIRVMPATKTKNMCVATITVDNNRQAVGTALQRYWLAERRVMSHQVNVIKLPCYCRFENFS